MTKKMMMWNPTTHPKRTFWPHQISQYFDNVARLGCSNTLGTLRKKHIDSQKIVVFCSSGLCKPNPSQILCMLLPSLSSKLEIGS